MFEARVCQSKDVNVKRGTRKHALMSQHNQSVSRVDEIFLA